MVVVPLPSMVTSPVVGGDGGHAGVTRLVSDDTGAGATCRGDSKGGISDALGEPGGGKSEWCLIYLAQFATVSFPSSVMSQL